MSEINFTWNESKNTTNKKKHGISFEEAKTVFWDEKAIEFFDEHHSDIEDRFILIGLSFNLRILVVCHCARDNKETTIRIISARKATKKEQKYYLGERK